MGTVGLAQDCTVPKQMHEGRDQRRSPLSLIKQQWLDNDLWPGCHHAGLFAMALYTSELAMATSLQSVRRSNLGRNSPCQSVLLFP